MSKKFSLKQLARYIEENVERIGRVRQEVAEIQVGFNSAYVEWKAQHDAELERLTEAILDQWDRVGDALHTRIEERREEEQRIIADRRVELRETLIPEKQAAADEVLAQGQALRQELRQLNPQLDRREERLKKLRNELEAELAHLNAEIKRLSGCLGVMFNFFKISKLDRERQRVIGQLEVTHNDLKEVREEWKMAQHKMSSERGQLQSRWKALTLEAAQLQAELGYLDEEPNREDLAQRRAVRYVVDHLVEPMACPVADLKQGLDHMVELNVQTDSYEAGLSAVVSLLALLDGLTEGLGRFAESVQGLLEEQRMHSAHLPKLSVAVPDDVLAFHARWDELRQEVQDDARLTQHPVEFVAAVGPTIERDLSEEQIKGMFERLGAALNRATQSWRG
jgi:chromosome segregation ATPase